MDTLATRRRPPSLFEARDARWQWTFPAAVLIEYEAVLKREQHGVHHLDVSIRLPPD
jgi:hypothetical protein